MKTIRWKFASVFVAVTAAIMVFVLILFNIAVGIYFERSVRLELRNTFTAMNVLIEKQLTLPPTGKDGGAPASNALGLSAVLTAYKISGNTEFFIFDDRYTLLFPREAGGTMLNEATMRQIRAYNFDKEGHIERVRMPGDVHYIAGMALDDGDDGAARVVFVSGMSGKRAMLGVMNIFLAGIMAVALLIGVLSAVTSANNLTRPIKTVCRYAREIGGGNFLTIPPDDSSMETSELIAGINDMSRRLKAADRVQKQFLQNASHELRTPLMSIQGYAEAIEQGVIAEPKEAAAVIRAESVRLTALVEEIMTLSKMDSSIYDKDFRPVDLGEALSDCIDRLNGLALKNGKTIRSSLLPKVMVLADETLLGQVMSNVISNGIRYAKETVTVRMRVEDRQALVIVADDGDGISETDLPHLFERFYKGRNGNFGLGLAIAKKALELLGGVIEVKNGEKGAEFTIRLLPVS